MFMKLESILSNAALRSSAVPSLHCAGSGCKTVFESSARSCRPFGFRGVVCFSHSRLSKSPSGRERPRSALHTRYTSRRSRIGLRSQGPPCPVLCTRNGQPAGCDFPDRSSAKEWNKREPFVSAGAYGSVTIQAFQTGWLKHRLARARKRIAAKGKEKRGLDASHPSPRVSGLSQTCR